MRTYSTVEYWDKRYREQLSSDAKEFDWLVTYDALKPFVAKHIPNKQGRVLDLGSGNSRTQQREFG